MTVYSDGTSLTSHFICPVVCASGKCWPLFLSFVFFCKTLAHITHQKMKIRWKISHLKQIDKNAWTSNLSFKCFIHLFTAVIIRRSIWELYHLRNVRHESVLQWMAKRVLHIVVDSSGISWVDKIKASKSDCIIRYSVVNEGKHLAEHIAKLAAVDVLVLGSDNGATFTCSSIMLAGDAHCIALLLALDSLPYLFTCLLACWLACFI